MLDAEQLDAAPETALEPSQTDENTPPKPNTLDGDSGGFKSDTEPESEMFPRAYVEQLRRESAGYRDKAKQAAHDAEDANNYAEGFMRRLHTELVRATGVLADPADLEFDPEHVMSEESLHSALDALIADKPHLKARRVAGDVGQGNRGPAAEFSLLDVLKSRA